MRAFLSVLTLSFLFLGCGGSTAPAVEGSDSHKADGKPCPCKHAEGQAHEHHEGGDCPHHKADAEAK